MLAIKTLRDLAALATDQVPEILQLLHISDVYTITILQYLILVGMGIFCCIYSTPRVAEDYLLCVALGDLHVIYNIYSGLEQDLSFDVATWNDMFWI